MSTGGRGLQWGRWRDNKLAGLGLRLCSWLPEWVLWVAGCTGQGPHLETQGKAERPVQMQTAGSGGLATGPKKGWDGGVRPLCPLRLAQGCSLPRWETGTGSLAREEVHSASWDLLSGTGMSHGWVSSRL